MKKLASTALSAIAVVVGGACSAQSSRAGDDARNSITVVYNHEATPSTSGLLKRGGFSAFVRLEHRSLIFDTGGEATVVLENLESLGFGGAELEAVVISHNHWDHVYGLPGVMSSARNSPPVYVAEPSAESLDQQYPRATVVAVKGPMQISPGVWLTGPVEIEFMGAPFFEQALVIEAPDGLHIIVGCSHPGIVNLVERAKTMFPDTPIALVAGGFHLRSTDEREIRQIASDLERLEVQKIGPTHCTGRTAVDIFRKRWGDRFISFVLGDSYRF